MIDGGGGDGALTGHFEGRFLRTSPGDVAGQAKFRQVAVFNFTSRRFRKSVARQELADRLVTRPDDERRRQLPAAQRLNVLAQPVQNGLFDAASQRTTTQQKRVELEHIRACFVGLQYADAYQAVIAEAILRLDDEDRGIGSQSLNFGQTPAFERQVELVRLLGQLGDARQVTGCRAAHLDDELQ